MFLLRHNKGSLFEKNFAILFVSVENVIWKEKAQKREKSYKIYEFQFW